MKGIILVTHSTMCEGVKKSCEMIVGEQSNIETVSLTEEGVEIFRKILSNKITEMSKDYESIFLVTDIPHATPYNECYRYILAHKNKIKLITGMSLAMVVELAIYSNLDINDKQLMKQILETGKNSIEMK